MRWSNDETQVKKTKTDTTTKILIAIIVCVILIIILILFLLFNIQMNTFNLIIDGKTQKNYDINKLITDMDDLTYINIEEFARLVNYEYHGGEYKSFTLEEGKCYVQGIEETATFYANDNKVCKLPLNKLQDEYREYTIENTIRIKDNKMYAPIEAIDLAFNVVVNKKEKSLSIDTLRELVSIYDKKVKEWGYSGIIDQQLENQKALLYGYIIVNKENGLYKIIDNKNTKEIVPDKYKSIEFSENTQEFLVTNSLGQVGIINLDGTTKIEPTYESITVLDKKEGLYLVQKNKKYGVVKSGNATVISTEYDSVGLTNLSSNSIIDNKYFVYNSLIPVCQNNKWGAFDKNGNLVLKLEYDGFGCSNTTIEVNGIKKSVEPVFLIERCNGIVVERNEKYKVIDVTGKELVSTAVDAIYMYEGLEDVKYNYYMLYNNKELNIIEELINAGLIEKDESEKKSKEEEDNNNVITVPTNNIDNSSNTENNVIDANNINQSQNNTIN